MPPQKKEKEKNQHIQVGVRCRPLDTAEKKRGSYNVVNLDESHREVSVKERALPTAPEKTFMFDKVFGVNSKQIEVYNSMVSPVIKEVLMGYNCTIFAYGQTGTGKTFTMEGDRSEDENISWEDDPLCGIIPRAMAQLFTSLESNPDCEFSVRVSFLEIYNEELIDLLGAESVENPRLKIYEDTTKKGSCVIQGLEEVVVHSKNDVYGILERGSARRQTAATLMNAHSSRSHSLFMVTIHIKESSTEGEEMLKTGKLNLVDLAGSECIGRSGAVDKRAREAGQINQSLLTLGRVITALVEHAPHVPYRESKLTRLLQDSLGGRTKTSIIATISPASCNIEETLSTLDYAYRAKNITNRPEINQKLTKRALLKTYNEEIERLRKDLQAARDKNGVFLAQDNYDQMQTEIIQKTDTIKELEDQMEMLTGEMAKIQEMFNITKEKLEETEQTLEDTSNKLVDTKKNLVKTTQDRDEQKFLVSNHIKSETKLHSQATQLLGTVEISTSDVEGLHSKLDRKKDVEAKNETTQERFRNNFHNSISTMQTNLKSQSEGQIAALRTVDDNLAAVIKKRSQEVDELVSSLDAVTSQVSRDTTSLDEVLKSASNQSENRIEAMVLKCNETRDTEICRQFDFQEQTFQVAMDNLSSLLRNCKQSLSDTAAEMTKQLSQQRELVEKVTSENLVRLEKQHQLVEDYCASHVESVEEQMKTNKNNTDNLLSSMQEMFDKLKANITTNSSQLTESMESNKQNITAFLEGTKVNHAECSTQMTGAKSRLLEQADSHSETLQASNTQFGNQVDDLLEKQNAVQQEVSTFSTQTQEDCRSKTDALIEMLNTYTTEQKSGLETHLTSLQKLQSQHAESIKNVKEGQSTQHAELTSSVSAEQGSLAQSRTNIAEWSETVSADLQKRDQDVEKFLVEELTKDVPTGMTPQRREFHYPRVLDKTQRHSLLLQDFRKDYDINMAMETPLPDDSFASQSAISEEPDMSSVHSAHDMSGDSAVSTASGLSSIDGMTTEKIENKENKMAPPHKKTVVKGRHASSTKTAVSRSRTPTPRKIDNITPSKKSASDNTPKSKLPLRSSNGNN